MGWGVAGSRVGGAASVPPPPERHFGESRGEVGAAGLVLYWGGGGGGGSPEGSLAQGVSQQPPQGAEEGHRPQTLGLGPV